MSSPASISNDKQITHEQGRCLGRTRDCVSGIVLPIFLIIATAFIISCALNPSGTIVQITSNFSVSVPLLVWSCVGATTAILLTVQLVRFKGFLQGRTRLVLHPSTEKVPKLTTTRIQLGDNIFFVPTYATRDHVQLEGFWRASSRNYQKAPTVLLFHGNGSSKYQMTHWAEFYKGRGFNVFIAEYRGYQPDSGICAGPNQEMEAYLDAEAALSWVLDTGVDKTKILAHGSSLGGAYAAALGRFYSIEHLVLEQTFTKLSDVAAHVMPCRILRPLARLVANTAYDSGSLETENGQTLMTDNFNTAKKVKEMKGKIFVIQSNQDHLMPTSFGKQLVAMNESEWLVNVQGGHSCHNFFSDPEAIGQLNRFLQERQLISEDFSAN